MANSFNYAEQWNKELLQTIIQGTLCSPFISSNVRWLNAKTFQFPMLTTTGYKDHSRNGGWNRGNATKTDLPYTLYHDRDVEFLVDKADVDETNEVASIQNISQRFIDTQANPETDAEFFSKVAQEAIENGLHIGYDSTSAAWTKSNVFSRLKTALKAGKLRVYKQRGSLIMYVRSDIMDLLEQSTDFTRKIEMTQIADGGLGIETRVTEIDGVPIMEVIDDERFYTAFNFNPTDGGFVPLEAEYELTEDTDVVEGKTYYTRSGSAGSYVYTEVETPVKTDIATYYEKTVEEARQLSVLIASTEMVKHVTKINSIYFFAAGQHTLGDGYLYQNRAYSGTFVFPNGKNGEIDSIYAIYDGATME